VRETGYRSRAHGRQPICGLHYNRIVKNYRNRPARRRYADGGDGSHHRASPSAMSNPTVVLFIPDSSSLKGYHIFLSGTSRCRYGDVKKGRRPARRAQSPSMAPFEARRAWMASDAVPSPRGSPTEHDWAGKPGGGYFFFPFFSQSFSHFRASASAAARSSSLRTSLAARASASARLRRDISRSRVAEEALSGSCRAARAARASPSRKSASRSAQA
jgi:hypothetical protein